MRIFINCGALDHLARTQHSCVAAIGDLRLGHLRQWNATASSRPGVEQLRARSAAAVAQLDQLGRRAAVQELLVRLVALRSRLADNAQPIGWQLANRTAALTPHSLGAASARPHPAFASLPLVASLPSLTSSIGLRPAGLSFAANQIASFPQVKPLDPNWLAEFGRQEIANSVAMAQVRNASLFQSILSGGGNPFPNTGNVNPVGSFPQITAGLQLNLAPIAGALNIARMPLPGGFTPIV